MIMNCFPVVYGDCGEGITLYHYNSSFSEEYKRDIEDFISEENFQQLEHKLKNTQSFTDFLSCKIIYALMLRVFVEKKFYDCTDSKVHDQLNKEKS